MHASMVSVNVSDFRLPPKDGFRAASALSFRSVELTTVDGDLAPSGLSSSGRRHLNVYTRGLGLRLCGLAADLPGLRLADPATVDERVSRTCEILELAADLAVPVVSSGIGALRHPGSGEVPPLALEALKRIGAFADSRGVAFAVRPSSDPGEAVARVLAELRCPSIRVCLDPAAMVMSGANPFTVLEHVAGDIGVVYARDGKVGTAECTGQETPLGQGEVDLVGVLGAVEAAEFSGPFVIRCLDSRDPAADIGQARAVLEGLLPSS